MIARTVALLFALSATGAEAHDYWTDGKPIPDWVKAMADAYPSGRRCQAWTEIIGSSTGTTAAAASPASTASSCRWTSDFLRPDVDPAPASVRRRDGASASALSRAGGQAMVNFF